MQSRKCWIGICFNRAKKKERELPRQWRVHTHSHVGHLIVVLEAATGSTGVEARDEQFPCHRVNPPVHKTTTYDFKALPRRNNHTTSHSQPYPCCEAQSISSVHYSFLEGTLGGRGENGVHRPCREATLPYRVRHRVVGHVPATLEAYSVPKEGKAVRAP